MTTTRSTAFSYNYAIICRVPRSFAERGALAEGRQIDYEAARDEHRQLVDVLRKCSLNIIELQEDEDYKDCCCVEDCAVIIGGTALITRPGLKVRQGEEIFVGIGKNTNEAGAQAVAEAFPEYVVVPIYMEATKALHLKSLCSMAGRQVIAVSSSDCGTKIYRVLDEKILNPRHQTSINELSKARVTLSSLVLLINKEKRARKLVSNLQDEDMDRYATIKTLK
ncbi:DDAH1-like protein [Mya arenaria]|uniref:DDAH1-like protein n=1 Tax=Mya arenaria TaxID=6604 RepID=A0ABY7G7U6_MYAAR|nr:DDAH1-like protein [Mya arenaria]